jgi:hypothetical protein
MRFRDVGLCECIACLPPVPGGRSIGIDLPRLSRVTGCTVYAVDAGKSRPGRTGSRLKSAADR